jgi:hypothetical protein
MIKRFTCIVLVIAVALISVPSLAVTTSDNITISLNGNPLALAAKSKMVNGRILVPAALLAKELGATAEWISATKSIYISLSTRDKNKTISLKVGHAGALVDGIEVSLDTPAIIYENRVYAPLRFISENFGAKVKWNGRTRTVNITYTIPQEEAPELIPPWELQNR